MGPDGRWIVSDQPAGGQQSGSGPRRIRDLDAAYEVIRAGFGQGNCKSSLDTCKRNTEGLSRNVNDLQRSLNDLQNRCQQTELNFGQCTNQRSQLTIQITNFTSEVSKWRDQFTTASDRLKQCQDSVNSQNTNAANENKILRGKLQFLYDVAGNCRQNFNNLLGDKANLINAFADLTSFVNNMPALTDIRGDLTTKFDAIAKERNNFRKKVELIRVIISSFANKVDDYNKTLKTDGYEGLLSGNDSNQSYGTWVFNPVNDGVDLNDLSDVNKCRSAVIVLKEKLTVVSGNLNTAIRNNNECLKKFGEFTNMMIGSSGVEDF